MKKLMISALALVALAGCSKTEPNAGPVAIVPHAGINLAKAPIVGTTFPDGNSIFASTAYAGTAVPTANYQTTLFDEIAVNSASSVLSYAAKQYYPANGDAVFFYGWAPAAGGYTKGTASDKPKVAFTITGQEDIMHGLDVTTKPTRDNGKQPAYVFSHMLKQVQFKVIAGEGFPASGTTVKSITIKDESTNPTMDVISGTLTWDTGAGASADLKAVENGTQAITGTLSDAFGAVMFKEGATFKIKVVVTNGGNDITYDNVTVTLQDNAGTAGNSYAVTLTFKGTEIVPTASITPWASVDGGGVDLK